MIEVILLTGLGFFFSLIIVIISSALNNTEEEFQNFLPGYNCGACGFGTCNNMAREMNKDPRVFDRCKPMKKEARENLYNYLKERGYIE